MAKKNKQAKKMAAAGKSAAQIKAKTGVGSQTAQRYVAKQAPTPPPSTSTTTPPTTTPPTPSRLHLKSKVLVRGLELPEKTALVRVTSGLLQKLRVRILRRSSVNSIRSTLN
jgi:transposase